MVVAAARAASCVETKLLNEAKAALSPPAAATCVAKVEDVVECARVEVLVVLEMAVLDECNTFPISKVTLLPAKPFEFTLRLLARAVVDACAVTALVRTFATSEAFTLSTAA